jgi:hypothetical protein
MYVLGEQQDGLQSSLVKGLRGHALASRIRSLSPSTPAGTQLPLAMALEGEVVHDQIVPMRTFG